MLKVHAGRFPERMKDPIPFGLVSWASDTCQLKSRNAPFSIVLSDNDTKWTVTFQDKKTELWHTTGGECCMDVESGIIRIDSEGMLDFWMELKRV